MTPGADPAGTTLPRPVATLRFTEASGAAALPERPTDDELVAIAPGWAHVKQTFPGATLRKLFGAASGIDALVDLAGRRTPSYDAAKKLLRFRSYFRLVLPADADAEAARTLLLGALPLGYLAIQTHETPLPVLAGELYEKQGHLHPVIGHITPIGGDGHKAGEGIDLEAVEGKPGGRGQGQALADVERGWDLAHPTLAALEGAQKIELLPGGVSGSKEEHGFHTLAVIASQGDGQQHPVGIAPGLETILLSSLHRSGGGEDRKEAVLEALKRLVTLPKRGQVLLLELQVRAHEVVIQAPPLDAKANLPCEVLDELFDLLELATALQVVVVEPAGNGNNGIGNATFLDLDALEVVDAAGLAFKPFDRGTRDSGAILVGESEWDAVGGQHAPVGKGCRGKRVDVFAWGVAVPVPNLLPPPATTVWSGTSAASAIIAGACLVVQGLREGLGLLPLTPAQLRVLLTAPDVGTASTPANAGIGVMPALGKVYDKLAALPDLYVRDNVLDDGGPHSGPLSCSPDIIVRRGPAPSWADAQAAYDEASGTAADPFLSESPVEGQPAHVMVRVRNRGGSPATGATVMVHYALPATLLVPSAWTAIGEAPLKAVPATDALVVSEPLEWTAPQAGHYCLVAVVHHDEDPATAPTATFNGAPLGFMDWVRLNNNVAWRNVNVMQEEPVPEASSGFGGLGPAWLMPFDAVGAPDAERVMELQVRVRSTQGTKVWLELPTTVAARLGLARGTLREGRTPDTRVLPFGKAVTTTLGPLAFQRGERIPVTLAVHVPDKERGPTLEVAVVQRCQQREVGRITWLLRTGKRTRPEEDAPVA